MNPITTALDHADFRTAFIRRMIASHERQSSTRLPRRPSLLFILALALSAGITSSSHAQEADKQQKSDRLLKRFPDADTNKDGKLSQEEAKAYIAANPQLKRNKQADPGVKSVEEDGDKDVSEAVLKLYEAREFNGAKYRLLQPINLEMNSDKKYPMVLSLHGAGGTGTDNVRNLRHWNAVMAEDEFRRKYPCFVVVPQTELPWQSKDSVAYFTDENIGKMSKEWKAVAGGRLGRMQRDPSGAKLDSVFMLLDALAEEYPIDKDRVYVLGHSMGGFGTYTALATQPKRFAAAITAAGWPGPWLEAEGFKDTPIWSFQGAKDKPEQVILGNATFEWMKSIGANMKFTEVANIGHGVMVPAFSYTGDTKENTGVTRFASDRCDKTSNVWDWLFSKKRAASTVRSEKTPDAPKAAEKPTAGEVPATRKGKIKGQEGEKRGARLEPTHADVSYGDHIRQKFDVWLPVGKGGPVPVHVYFHGGGFVGGKKTDFDPRPFVNAGFAAVSGSYRLLDGMNTLGPVPMQDGARVIQAIRLNAAKWNIDPARISVSGSSAGAVIAMWIGYHDDLAQPESEDPIARQSSRVKCIAPINGPTNMDPIWIRSNLGGPHEIHPTLPKMYGVTEGFDKPDVRARIKASNPWEMVSANDPPTLMIYARNTEPMPLAASVGTSYLIHHPQFGVALKKKLDDTGIANELHTGIQYRQGNTLIVNWLKTQFK